MNFQAAARAITGSKDKQEDAWRVYDLKGDVGGVARSDVGSAVTGGGLILVADGIGGPPIPSCRLSFLFPAMPKTVCASH
ncbi:MAG TPA: hypothetical protein PKB01_09395 [Xanthobacteraceae bacterium]|nr:hypothetical protein [Xanthobacteraceae bacterium]